MSPSGAVESQRKSPPHERRGVFSIRRGNSFPTFERAVAGVRADAGVADRASHQVPHPPA